MLSLELVQKLKTLGQVKFNEPMSRHTTFKIGGNAAVYFEATKEAELVAALREMEAVGAPYLVVGSGSNILFSDQSYDGVVIAPKLRQIEVKDLEITAGAGALTAAVSEAAMKASLAGFEWGAGVPGTIGGAVWGNAGAMGKEMADNLVSVRVYEDGEVVEYEKKDCGFYYRGSRFKSAPGVIILSVCLRLEAGDRAASLKMIMENLEFRKNHQPKGLPTCGCVFKNYTIKNEIEKKRLKEIFEKNFPDDLLFENFLAKNSLPAGYLIEKAGLKETSVGQAEISSVHGNFIVNLGGATAEDVKNLVELAQDKVREFFGVDLEEEMISF